MDGGASAGGPPPGWYPDPEDPRQQRWWDGVGWTDNRMPTVAGPASTWDPLYGQTSVAQPGGYVGAPGGMPAPGGDVRGLAIASLVLGIAGLVFSLVCWPIGIVCALIGLPLGGVALTRISKGEADPSSRGMALAGVILSGIAVALAMVALIWLGAVFSELNRL